MTERIQPAEHLPFDPRDRSAASLAIAEAICAIDEANKHTAQMDELFKTIRDYVAEMTKYRNFVGINCQVPVCDWRADELLFTDIGRRALKVCCFTPAPTFTKKLRSHLTSSEKIAEPDLFRFGSNFAHVFGNFVNVWAPRPLLLL